MVWEAEWPGAQGPEEQAAWSASVLGLRTGHLFFNSVCVNLIQVGPAAPRD